MALSKEQLTAYREKYNIGGVAAATPEKSFFAGAAEDLKEGFQGAVDAVDRGVERVNTVSQRPSLLTRISGTVGAGFRAAGEALGSLGEGAVRALPGGTTVSDALRNVTKAVAEPIVQSEAAKSAGRTFNTLPRTIRDVLGDAGNILFGSASIGGAVTVPGATGKATQALGSLFKRPVGSVDDVIEQADEVLTVPKTNGPSVQIPVRDADPQTINNFKQSLKNEVKVNVQNNIDLASVNERLDKLIEQGDFAGASRAAAEVAQAPVSLKERWIGIQPDIKKRIAGKQDKLKEYFDVAHARNADDTKQTAYEYGSSQAQVAVDKMEERLSESGGKIGETRKKLGTYKAAPAQVEALDTSFTGELSKLNLEVRNGVIRQKPGTVTKVAAKNDINVLNDLYQDFQVVKQSPTLTNIIEFRSQLDLSINFGKRTQEVSNSVDPLSRSMRKKMAEVAAGVVGKTEAAEVARYSDFIEAYNDLRSYTDRRAGGEYLLRLVLSGRGGEARQIIDTIREYTGIDLMDDATMMTIATDLIGNSRQKNLFRQEVTKAGLDAARVLHGDTSGAAGLLSDFVTKHFMDEEQTFLDAAK